MSPRTDNQNIEIRKATKKRIMDAALELFANEGYHTTSVNRIAKQAGMSKGLMYNYFNSKEDLLKELVFWGIESTLESFDLNKDGVLTRNELLHFIRQSFQLMKENRDFWKLYYTIIYQPAVMKLMGKEIYKKYEQYNRIITAYFQSTGIEDPLTEMRFFTALMDGVALSYLMDQRNYPIDELIEKIISKYS